MLAKVGTDMKSLWESPASMDAVMTAPVEYGGTVYACSGKGLVSAVRADNGQVLWQYQATPSSFVLASAGVSGEYTYVVGTDGSLTAFRR
jgi:outer membrane protein assembly factor BamB